MNARSPEEKTQPCPLLPSCQSIWEHVGAEPRSAAKNDVACSQYRHEFYETMALRAGAERPVLRPGVTVTHATDKEKDVTGNIVHATDKIPNAEVFVGSDGAPGDKLCEHCQSWFKPKRSDAVYCSTSCRQKAARKPKINATRGST